MAFFTQLEQKFLEICMETQKIPQKSKQSWERETEQEEVNAPTLDSTTKLQSSKQYGTGTKTEV